VPFFFFFFFFFIVGKRLYGSPCLRGQGTGYVGLPPNQGRYTHKNPTFSGIWAKDGSRDRAEHAPRSALAQTSPRRDSPPEVSSRSKPKGCPNRDALDASGPPALSVPHPKPLVGRPGRYPAADDHERHTSSPCIEILPHEGRKTGGGCTLFRPSTAAGADRLCACGPSCVSFPGEHWDLAPAPAQRPPSAT
jgi:hypothetical protein